MKGKDIKQWVLNKKKSFGGPQGNNRTQSGREGGSMDIDTILSPSDEEQAPPKTVFHAKGTPFRMDPRYSYVKTLGLGAYGIVCAADDAKMAKRVAVKKVAGVFEDLTDAKRIIREIRLMSSMSHENILQILDIDDPESYEKFSDVYIVTELMDTDMNKLLRSKHPLIDNQRKYFAYQIFRAMKYIHSANILHRDLKPANILVSATVRYFCNRDLEHYTTICSGNTNTNPIRISSHTNSFLQFRQAQCDIKICDFGLARYMGPSDEPKQEMTEYVVTRWYRAPELLLAAEEYTAAIDMWSIGCLIAELYCRKPLFPGNDIKNQIEVICKVLGKPSPEEIDTILNPRARDFVSRVPESSRANLADLLPGACSAAQDLINRLLQFDPAKRMSAEEALAHPYLAEYRDPDSETSGTQIDHHVLEPPSEKKLGEEGIRRLMWDEILKFHPEARAREPPVAHYAETIVKRVVSQAYKA